MNTPTVHAIAAIGKSPDGRWVLGKGSELLWRIPEDLQRFKALTLGHPIMMGRKTFESIGRPLPGRTNIVITRDTSWAHEGILVSNSAEDALARAVAVDSEKIFVIGGGEIYQQMFPYTDVLNLTIIEDIKEGDVFFPPFEKEFTRETFREDRATAGGLKYAWVDFARI